jgi:NAD(P)-dependent dehydrogenase (short-subunit alcohol dehydrogenase family)
MTNETLQRLAGRSAVITGAAAGVGRAAALLFAREGAAVACVDGHRAMGEETAAMVCEEGGEAIFVESDLTDPGSIARMAAACIAWRSAIHVLFNCASAAEPAAFEDLTLASWNHQLALNLTAPFLCSQRLLPALEAAGGAAIVHHGSIDGVLGNPSLAAYSCAKGGLQALTHVMGFSLAPRGISVNCINTAALRESREGIPLGVARARRPFTDAQRRATPLARPAYVEEAAQAALFLACDESSYVNGSVLTLDGGRSVITPGTF